MPDLPEDVVRSMQRWFVIIALLVLASLAFIGAGFTCAQPEPAPTLTPR